MIQCGGVAWAGKEAVSSLVERVEPDPFGLFQVLTVLVVLLVYFTLIYTDVLRVEHFLTIRKHLGMKGEVVIQLIVFF